MHRPKVLPDIQFGIRWPDDDPLEEDISVWAEKQALAFASPRRAKGKGKNAGNWNSAQPWGKGWNGGGWNAQQQPYQSGPKGKEGGKKGKKGEAGEEQWKVGADAQVFRDMPYNAEDATTRL